ncbi:MAG: DeoR/GlpR family DNA-binding transcription regulator [Brevinema sp.]
MKNTDDRQSRVLYLLQEKKFVTTEEMISHLQLSEATVRRLLTQMEKQGIVRRFHGGVSLRTAYNNIFDTHIDLEKEKKSIAKYACENFINDGDTIFIGSGTTTGYMKDYLGSVRNLTIVTNNLLLLPSILKMEHIQLILTGGIATPNIPSLIGALYPAEYLTNHIAVNSAFLTSEAVSITGSSQKSTAELHFEMAFINLPIKKVLMADHSKLGVQRPFVVAPLNKFDILLTDKETPQATELKALIPVYFTSRQK